MPETVPASEFTRNFGRYRMRAQRRHLTLEGLADVDSGCLIDDAVMQAWVDSLGTDRELPVPQPD